MATTQLDVNPNTEESSNGLTQAQSLPTYQGQLSNGQIPVGVDASKFAPQPLPGAEQNDTNAAASANNPMGLGPNTETSNGLSTNAQGQIVPPTAPPTTPEQQTAEKYQTTLSNLQSGATPPPQTPGAATAAITGATPPPPAPGPNTGLINQNIQSDQGLQEIIQNYQQAFSPQAQQQSLAQEYQTMMQQSGLPAVNTQLMNMKNVMDGSEQDIRNEITKAGGFATESQVQSLTNARNKTLIQNYNNLLNYKTSLQDQVDTMIGLAGQDRNFAQAQLMDHFQVASKIAEMQQTMQKNATDTMANNIKSFGAKAVYDAALASGDPTAIARINSVMGPGFDIKSIAEQPMSEEDKLDLEYRKGQIASQKSDLQTDVLTRANLQSQINERNNKNVVSPATKTQQLAQAQSNITSVDDILKDTAIRSAVGPTMLGRLVGRGLDNLTGSRQNFIAGVEQLRSQLTLDSLINAKARGATFGALSEGELNTLSQSASKLGKWATTDKSGKVTGYSANEKDFKAELDKINNFAKLDYVLKGGEPTSVGIQKMPDGSYVTKNSDGSYTVLE